MKFEDATKEFEGKTFPFNDCRELLIMYIFTAQELAKIGKIDESHIDDGIRVLDMTLRSAFEVPESVRNIVNKVKKTLDEASDNANNVCKDAAIKQKLNELLDLVMPDGQADISDMALTELCTMLIIAKHKKK